jgi:hypothetical protein
MYGSVKTNQVVFWQLLPKLGPEQGATELLKTTPEGKVLMALT